MDYYFDAFKKYVIFSGRATRTQYWMFVLINGIIIIVLDLIASMGGNSALHLVLSSLLSLYGLVLIIPTLAITARRLHDMGTSGWWQLLYLIPLLGGLVIFILTLIGSQPAENKYGPNPKAAPVPPVPSTSPIV